MDMRVDREDSCEKLMAPAEDAPENEDDDEAANDDEGNVFNQDCEPMRRAPKPYQPTCQEVEEHNETHYPYRSWCRWCREGKALGEQHRRDSR